MKLSEIIKELNKENTPPGGWKPEDKVPSSQAGGPAHKESGFKQVDKSTSSGI
tara:strand:- start:297 stop:455 length:159 start_codon:yes stop_codon:yes gene_type:complete